MKNVERMEETRHTHKILVGNPDRKRHTGVDKRILTRIFKKQDVKVVIGLIWLRIREH
jgi:hypothetical protein